MTNAERAGAAFAGKLTPRQQARFRARAAALIEKMKPELEQVAANIQAANDNLESRGLSLNVVDMDDLIHAGYMIGIDASEMTAREVYERLVAWDDAERHKARLAEAIHVPQQEKKSDEKPPQYVTLAEAATLAKVHKKTADRWLKQAKLPEPDVLGGRGKSNKWRWNALRPALEKQIGHSLPERFPSLFPEI